MKTTDPHFLESSYPIYLILLSQEGERKRIFERIKKVVTGEWLVFDQEQLLLAKEEMQQMSLFSDSKVIVLDGIESYAAKELSVLEEMISRRQEGITFVLGAGEKRAVSKVYALIEKEGIVLDLVSEKPWERDKRLIHSLQERAKMLGKILPSEVASLLLERMGSELPMIEQEIDKLVAFVGERERIERRDVETVSSSFDVETVWQKVSSFVWEEGSSISEELDSTTFFVWVAHLRTELRLGYQIATLLEEGVHDLSSHFPKVWPKTLEKKRMVVVKRGSQFFIGALRRLFSIELKAKDGISCFSALLLTLFQRDENL